MYANDTTLLSTLDNFISNHTTKLDIEMNKYRISQDNRLGSSE